MGRKTEVKSQCDIPRDYKRWYVLAKSLGWRVSFTGSGHLKWQPPRGRCVFTPCSPSDRDIQVYRKLKKAGLPI